jgi:putative transposase
MAELIAARDWLTVYRLPAYAHELNPVEPVWSHLKRSLANLAKRNLAQLTALVKPGLNGCSTGRLSSAASSPAPALTSHPSCNPPQLEIFFTASGVVSCCGAGRGAASLVSEPHDA